jgi:hypothetical protein
MLYTSIADWGQADGGQLDRYGRLATTPRQFIVDVTPRNIFSKVSGVSVQVSAGPLAQKTASLISKRNFIKIKYRISNKEC